MPVPPPLNLPRDLESQYQLLSELANLTGYDWKNHVSTNVRPENQRFEAQIIPHIDDSKLRHQFVANLIHMHKHVPETDPMDMYVPRMEPVVHGLRNMPDSHIMIPKLFHNIARAIHNAHVDTQGQMPNEVTNRLKMLPIEREKIKARQEHNLIGETVNKGAGLASFARMWNGVTSGMAFNRVLGGLEGSLPGAVASSGGTFGNLRSNRGKHALKGVSHQAAEMTVRQATNYPRLQIGRNMENVLLSALGMGLGNRITWNHTLSLAPDWVEHQPIGVLLSQANNVPFGLHRSVVQGIGRAIPEMYSGDPMQTVIYRGTMEKPAIKGFEKEHSKLRKQLREQDDNLQEIHDHLDKKGPPLDHPKGQELFGPARMRRTEIPSATDGPQKVKGGAISDVGQTYYDALGGLAKGLTYMFREMNTRFRSPRQQQADSTVEPLSDHIRDMSQKKHRENHSDELEQARYQTAEDRADLLKLLGRETQNIADMKHGGAIEDWHHFLDRGRHKSMDDVYSDMSHFKGDPHDGVATRFLAMDKKGPGYIHTVSRHVFHDDPFHHYGVRLTHPMKDEPRGPLVSVTRDGGGLPLVRRLGFDEFGNHRPLLKKRFTGGAFPFERVDPIRAPEDLEQIDKQVKKLLKRKAPIFPDMLPTTGPWTNEGKLFRWKRYEQKAKLMTKKAPFDQPENRRILENISPKIIEDDLTGFLNNMHLKGITPTRVQMQHIAAEARRKAVSQATVYIAQREKQSARDNYNAFLQKQQAFTPNEPFLQTPAEQLKKLKEPTPEFIGPSRETIGDRVPTLRRARPTIQKEESPTIRETIIEGPPIEQPSIIPPFNRPVRGRGRGRGGRGGRGGRFNESIGDRVPTLRRRPRAKSPSPTIRETIIEGPPIEPIEPEPAQNVTVPRKTGMDLRREQRKQRFAREPAQNITEPVTEAKSVKKQQTFRLPWTSHNETFDFQSNDQNEVARKINSTTTGNKGWNLWTGQDWEPEIPKWGDIIESSNLNPDTTEADVASENQGIIDSTVFPTDEGTTPRWDPLGAWTSWVVPQEPEERAVQKVIRKPMLPNARSIAVSHIVGNQLQQGVQDALDKNMHNLINDWDPTEIARRAQRLKQYMSQMTAVPREKVINDQKVISAPMLYHKHVAAANLPGFSAGYLFHDGIKEIHINTMKDLNQVEKSGEVIGQRVFKVDPQTGKIMRVSPLQLQVHDVIIVVPPNVTNGNVAGAGLEEAAANENDQFAPMRFWGMRDKTLLHHHQHPIQVIRDLQGLQKRANRHAMLQNSRIPFSGAGLMSWEAHGLAKAGKAWWNATKKSGARVWHDVSHDARPIGQLFKHPSIGNLLGTGNAIANLAGDAFKGSVMTLNNAVNFVQNDPGLGLANAAFGLANPALLLAEFGIQGVNHAVSGGGIISGGAAHTVKKTKAIRGGKLNLGTFAGVGIGAAGATYGARQVKRMNDRLRQADQTDQSIFTGRPTPKLPEPALESAEEPLVTVKKFKGIKKGIVQREVKTGKFPEAREEVDITKLKPAKSGESFIQKIGSDAENVLKGAEKIIDEGGGLSGHNLVFIRPKNINRLERAAEQSRRHYGLAHDHMPRYLVNTRINEMGRNNKRATNPMKTIAEKRTHQAADIEYDREYHRLRSIHNIPEDPKGGKIGAATKAVAATGMALAAGKALHSWSQNRNTLNLARRATQQGTNIETARNTQLQADLLRNQNLRNPLVQDANNVVRQSFNALTTASQNAFQTLKKKPQP